MGLIENSVIIGFIITSILSIYLFYRGSNKNKKALWIILLYTIIHGVLAYNEFYLNFETVPPRFALVIVPATILIVLLFNLKSGKKFLDSFDHSKLIWIHIVRIPVEIILFKMPVAKLIPNAMTFAGTNFDIIA